MNEPEKVDRYKYWGEPPPWPSERLVWWLNRLVTDDWNPDVELDELLGNGYDSDAEGFGVYLWEYFNVLEPIVRVRLHWYRLTTRWGPDARF